MALSEVLADRQFIPQYTNGTDVGHLIYVNGVLTDPDGNNVVAEMMDLADPPATVFVRAATREDVGKYHVTVNSGDADIPGVYIVRFTYAIGGTGQYFDGYVEVGAASPAYDALDVGMMAIVEAVWVKFADLFDSPYGGPHLQVYFQTHFGRNRLAQLLKSALGKLNTIAQPHTTYSLEGPPNGKQFPYAQWGAVLEQGLYIETIKHLIRSYTEMFDKGTVQISTAERRDYMDRWKSVLDMELEDYKEQIESFKIAHMGLGSPSVIVAGGIFGDYGPDRLHPLNTARPKYWARYY